MTLGTLLHQPRALQLLQPALRAKKLHHALLFAGPSGVGKETAARALAAALLCEDSDRAELAESCGACDACGRVERSVHPDLIVVAPEVEAIARGLLAREDLPKAPSRELKIEQVRALEARLSVAPLRGRSRVVLIVSSDSLNVAAQNAFLKTLEEPPAGTHLVLLAENAEKLLPTIRSRCLRVPFAPLPPAFVAEKLVLRGLEPQVARLCAALAGGSLGAALALDAKALAGRTALLEAVEALEASELRPLLALAESIGGKGREDAELFLDVLALFYRDAAAAASHVPIDTLASADLPHLLERAAARGAGEAMRRFRIVGQARDAVRRHAAVRLTLERLLLSFVLPQEARS